MHLDALLCIYNTMHFHPLLHYLAFGDVIHSCALPYVCILYVMHISAFRCMFMRCILMHSNYDAFMCINSYSSSWRRNIAWFGCATRGAKIAWYLLHDCFMMRVNAKKYPNMREYAHRLVDHTNIHKRSRADSRLNSHGSMQHGQDGLRMGCGYEMHLKIWGVRMH